jgi:predicted metalloprotease
MSRRPAIVTAIAASALVLVGTGALAANSPQLSGYSPTKTTPAPVPTTAVPATTTPLVPPPSTAAPSTAAAPTAAPSTAAPSTAAPATGGVDGTGPHISEVVSTGNKPARFYDAYLAVGLADIQAWWADEYPRLYDEAWTPLEGGIFAAYPERTEPIPGCGFPGDTTYQEVSDFGAFYCPDGDFMAYDDGELGIIYELAERYSPSVVAVVMAHEFGHAVQNRIGVLDRDVATIYTEQQADCFSGAWARRVWEGQAVGITFGDEDIRTGLIALDVVADPIGTSVLEPGGHGAAFDRIGAFQEGFLGGVDNCVELIDKPLPLLPNEFVTTQDAQFGGNAPFGWGQNQIMDILQRDLTAFWPHQLASAGATMPALTIRPVTDPTTDNCDDAERMRTYAAVFCAASNEVLFDEGFGRVLYDDFGDFAIGYVIGLAWADAAQTALGSSLQGEPRALASDCFVGTWIATAIAGFDPGSAPATTAPAGRQMTVSPGDLDEAVRTALIIGDRGLGDNHQGSAFEKIAAMRRGVLNGLPACLADITG